ncbi:MAG: rRNA maturation RNase YbeY [Alistipes sp.]|jgi:rRNA maturation RNase YbeY|nr:rRNA maturation RNase YbeY [Alistipes sp.]
MGAKFYSDGSSFRLPDKGRATKWLGRVAESEGRRFGAVNFIFCGPERHLEMNRHYLGHDWPTDVITFDYSSEGEVSGDIFIDPETVAENAAALCVAPEVEMRRVMVHGVLHLCGFDDKTPRQRRAMRAKEDFYLARYYGETV